METKKYKTNMYLDMFLLFKERSVNAYDLGPDYVRVLTINLLDTLCASAGVGGGGRGRF